MQQVKKFLCRDRGSSPGHLRDRPTLYHVTIKAGLYHKAVEVCLISKLLHKYQVFMGKQIALED